MYYSNKKNMVTNIIVWLKTVNMIKRTNIIVCHFLYLIHWLIKTYAVKTK